MKEMLDVYDLDNNFIGTQERNEFYEAIEKEWADTGNITKKVKSIRVLLMNSDGRIYLQKRSQQKHHNAGLYDKTIGGHVINGHTFHITLVKECAEELGIPAVLLSHDEFIEGVPTTNLEIIGLFHNVETLEDFESQRVFEGETIVQPYITTVIIGYYDGSIRFCDGEASGVEVFALEDLEVDIKKHPEKYTADLKFMLNRYRDHLVPAAKLPTAIKFE